MKRRLSGPLHHAARVPAIALPMPCRDTPIASSARQVRSRLTSGLAASILATRDWLEPIRRASSSCVIPAASRARQSMRISRIFRSINSNVGTGLSSQQFHKFTPQDWKFVLNNAPRDFVVHLRVTVDDLVAKAGEKQRDVPSRLRETLAGHRLSHCK